MICKPKIIEKYLSAQVKAPFNGGTSVTLLSYHTLSLSLSPLLYTGGRWEPPSCHCIPWMLQLKRKHSFPVNATMEFCLWDPYMCPFLPMSCCTLSRVSTGKKPFSFGCLNLSYQGEWLDHHRLLTVVVLGFPFLPGHTQFIYFSCCLPFSINLMLFASPLFFFALLFLIVVIVPFWVP